MHSSDTVLTDNHSHHLLHISEGITNGPVQAAYWLPLFIASQQHFSVLTRYADVYEHIQLYYPQLSVMYARTAIEVESALSTLPNLKAIYYFSNTANCIHSLRFNEYEHIFLRNVATDKGATPHKFFRAYDQIWADSEEYIKRFKQAGFAPRHLTLRAMPPPSWGFVKTNSLEDRNNNQAKNIIYLLDWEDADESYNLSSHYLANSLINTIYNISNEIKVSLYVHPKMGQRNPLLKDTAVFIPALHSKKIAIQTLPTATQLFENLSEACCVVCDLSDYFLNFIMVAHLPIFLYIPTDREINPIWKDQLESIPYLETCYIFSTIDEFHRLFEKVVINHNDYLQEARLETIKFLQPNNNIFIESLKRIAQES